MIRGDRELFVVADRVLIRLDDKEEQLAVISTFVRLGVVVWAGFIISLNYIEIPGLGKQTPKDITFVALQKGPAA